MVGTAASTRCGLEISAVPLVNGTLKSTLIRIRLPVICLEDIKSLTVCLERVFCFLEADMVVVVACCTLYFFE